ncbi:hypothetical protein D3C81_2283070 [compost metagenome]
MSFKPWNTQTDKVIPIDAKTGVFTRAGKIIDHDIGVKVHAGAALALGATAAINQVAVSNIGHTAAITDALMTESQ